MSVPMDLGLFRHFIEVYVHEAMENSDGTISGIREYLWSVKEAGRFSRHRQEKNRALREVRQAFDEHRHWPLPIILSHLGIDSKG